MTKLVVGIDGSPPAQRALAWAVDEARLRDVPLEVVHVYRPPEIYPALTAYGYTPTSEEVDKEYRDHAEQVMDDALRGVDNVKIERTVVKSHRVAMELVTRSRDADLLIVGSRGRGGFAGLLLGSTSQQCVQHAECPVVVVPGRRGEEEDRPAE